MRYINDLHLRTKDEIWNLLEITTLALKICIKNKTRNARFFQLVRIRAELIWKLEETR